MDLLSRILEEQKGYKKEIIKDVKESTLMNIEDLLTKVEYKEAAELAKSYLGLSIDIKLHSFDYHFEGDKDKRDIYTITFEKGENNFIFKFGQSIANSVLFERKKPSAYDILSCIVKSNPEDFESFCVNYGYEIKEKSTFYIDGRDGLNQSSLRTYRRVRHEWTSLSNMFNEEEFEILREFN